MANIVPVIRQAMAEAQVQFSGLDAVAVTQGPGLVGSLLVGLQAAKAIAWVHGKPLVPVSNDATFFASGLPVFAETTELIITEARGKAVARTLGKHGALILRNHGIVTAAPTMEEAVFLALKLNQACHAQLMAQWAGGPKLVGDPAEAKTKGAYANRPDIHTGVFNYVLRRCGK
jgi:L-fuculose-phosphate aldolase